MKKNLNHLKDWEMLEKKWQERLNAHEEELPEGLWGKIEGRSNKEEGRRNKEEGIRKKGEGKSIVLIRWSAAAAVLLFMFFWIGFQREEEIEWKVESGKSKVAKTVPEYVEGREVKVESGELKVESGEVKVTKKAPERVEGGNLKHEKAIELLAQAPVKTEEPLENIKSEIVAETGKPLESVKSDVQAEVDEMVVVVDIEPIKKEKAINKIIGFIKKVKSGRLLDLTTKNREGKLNDGIHRVMYQYEEKEEKLKNSLSL